MLEKSYFCPHCDGFIKKTAQQYIAGQSRGSVMFGPDTMACPRCSRPIDLRKVINGDYDATPASVTAKDRRIVAIFVVLVLAFFGAYYFYGK